MFRDESTKVIQKAHAQWGMHDPFEAGDPSGSSPSSTSPSTASSRSRGSIAESVSSGPPTSPEGSRGGIRFPMEIDATKIDRAVQFYLEHYVIGHPDEARAGQELQEQTWVFSPTTREIMAAVGLASLSNLNGDKEMYTLARRQYGKALQHIANSIRNPQGLDIGVYLRAVVMLGLFEVRGPTSFPLWRHN